MRKGTTRGTSRLARWKEGLIFWGVTVLVAALGAVVAYQVGRNWVGKYLAQQKASRQAEQTELPSGPASGDLRTRVSLGPTVLIRERELTEAEKRELGLTQQSEEGEGTVEEGAGAGEETPASQTDTAEGETPADNETAAGEKEAADDSQPAENPPATESDNASSSQAPAPAWQVTAGSYRDERNAQQVVQSLQAQGLSAHVEEVQVRGQTFHRVIAGAYSSRDEAKTTADKVQAAGYPSQVLKKR